MSKIADIIVSVVLIGVGITIAIMATGMPEWGERLDSPGMLPFFIGLVIVLCAFSLFAGALKGKIYEKDEEADDEIPLHFLKWSEPEGRRTYLFLFLTIIYVLVMREYRFLYTTLFFLPLAFLILGIRSPVKIALLSIIPVVTVHVLFSNVFRILLP